ncbi:MAG: polyprenol monophosphomannose synthase [Pseudomonadota bacterium]
MTDARPIVIIPTYNEVTNLTELLNTVFSLPSRFDVLVVDDSSPDGTGNLVKTHPQFGRRLYLLERCTKAGLGTAYLDGFAWAFTRTYTHIAQMDADLSHDPSDLERLLDVAKGGGVALGSRYIPNGGVEGWSRRRLMLSRFANIYARWFTRVPVHDLTSGFKCYPRPILQSILALPVVAEGYAFQIETIVRVHRRGNSVTEVPILFRERRRGQSKISRKIVWEALWLVAKLGMGRAGSRRP